MYCAIIALAGCEAGPPDAADAPLLEPKVFHGWAKLTDRPVVVSPAASMLCSTTPQEIAAAKEFGPHASYSIVVRANSPINELLQNGGHCSPGTIVVKEKYQNSTATGPLHAYAMMKKREAGQRARFSGWSLRQAHAMSERASAG
jgi:hypothetical protein